MMNWCVQSTGCRPTRCVVDSEGTGLRSTEDAHIHRQIKGDLESQAEAFRQNVVLGSLCMFWSKE